MIQLLREPCESGTQCPKCENSSVFINHKYKFFSLVYQYSELKCEMGPLHCDYIKIFDKNKDDRK